MFPNTVLPPAELIRGRDAQNAAVRKQVIEILEVVHEKIKEAHKEGLHTIVVQLPFAIRIINMSIKQAQKTIWGNTLRELSNKGYGVGIKFNDSECMLKVTWETNEDRMEQQILEKIIKDSMHSFNS